MASASLNNFKIHLNLLVQTSSSIWILYSAEQLFKIVNGRGVEIVKEKLKHHQNTIHYAGHGPSIKSWFKSYFDTLFEQFNLNLDASFILLQKIEEKDCKT